MHGLPASEISRIDQMSLLERDLASRGFSCIAGVDEAGRGPLAGPVVAAACILPRGVYFQYLNDSKQLTTGIRNLLYAQLLAYPGFMYGISIIDVETIDRINILQATLMAMQRAVGSLPVSPDYILIDGSRTPSLGVPCECVIRGDARSVSIAAASVLAKVTRDRIMIELHEQYPEYGFFSHKGYATNQHLRAIEKHGSCPIHRTSFNPIRSCKERGIR